MKFTIIIPTYNDADMIEESLDSVLRQDYDNYEIIIVNDGSTDETESVVKKYIENNKIDKIIYLKQENKDQLNAIQTAIDYITGDYVYILHSDDILEDNMFKNAYNFFKSNEKYEGIISNLSIMNKKGDVIGEQKVRVYKKANYIQPLQLLWLGRNLFVDVVFIRTRSFLDKYRTNYLTWNTPFWLDLDSNTMLNIKKVNFNLFKYRVYDNNYVNNSIGKLNVINGELRTATRLMSYYYLPFYKTQYFLYRLLNKLKLKYIPIYFNKETKNKYKVISFIVKKRFSDKEIGDNLFLKGVLNFYKNYKSRTIKIPKLKNEQIFFGSDMRVFNKKLVKNDLSSFYNNILSEMNNGFDTIICEDKKDIEKVKNITKFLCIYPYVSVK